MESNLVRILPLLLFKKVTNYQQLMNRKCMEMTTKR